MSSEELKKHQEDIAKKRRSFAQARAIIQRGRDAGIPEKYIRVKQQEFEKLLCSKFHTNIKKFAELIYKEPQILFEKPYIVIDGGTPESRKKAGFSILFRMIACDKSGLSYDCGQLSSEFQTIRQNGENRNDVVLRLQKEPILLLSEFHQKKFNVHLPDSGNFFDQLLSSRTDYSKPTIITFMAPLECGAMNSGNAVKDDRCGSYLSMISHADIQKNDQVFRIRIK